jgi:hypothetical protein
MDRENRQKEMTPEDPFKRTFPDENYVPPDEADLRKQALQKAYEIARTISTEHSRPVLPPPPREWGPILRAANAALAVLVAAWLWLSPPVWLPVQAKDTRSAEQRSLGVRMVLALEASRVNAFADAQGHLPTSLAEAGGDGRDVRYTVVDATHYTLSARDGVQSATYDSATPLGSLLTEHAGR